MSSALPLKTIGCCFTWNDPSRPLSPVFFSPCATFYPSTSRIWYSSSPSHSIPRRRGIGKGAEARSEVRGRALACPAWSILRLFSLIHRQSRGDVTSVFKITHVLLEFPMESNFLHQAALWLSGLEAITDGLRDSKDLVLAGAKLAEASLFAAKPSSCLG